jgi:hypothetical protein
MELKATFAALFSALSIITFTQTADAADADDQPAPNSLNSTNSSAPSEGRFGLFDSLDHHSLYNAEFFPEPFLIDDIGLEDNEIESTWFHSKSSDQTSDIGSVEYQKGIGELTLQAEIPYESNVSPGQSTHGFGNIQLGARYPLYQVISASGMIDATFGLAMEGGIPVDSTVSQNPELEPEIFNALRLGDHFAIQSVFGYSTLLGAGDDGGTETLEYGFSFDYLIPSRDLRLPAVQQIIPMVELSGERGLNLDEAGQNSFLGGAGFRAEFKPIGDMQPNLGLDYVFPLDKGAREELHWGFIVSVILEF